MEDAGEAIVPRTLEAVVARAPALIRELLAGKLDVTVEDVLAVRAAEAGREW